MRRDDGVVLSKAVGEADQAGEHRAAADTHIVQTNPKAVERVSIKLYDHIERRICPAGALACMRPHSGVVCVCLLAVAYRSHVSSSGCVFSASQ